MQEHVLGRFYSAGTSKVDNIREQHTFLIHTAGQSLSKLKERLSRTKIELC